jgi:hypothetical protein
MSTTRIIQREFVVQQGFETLPAVTLGYAWSSFMNTYAVWPSGAGDSVIIRRTVELQKGYYYVTGTVDNYGSVSINGEYNINLYNFDVNISRTELRNNTRVYHPGGDMNIVISATNTGGPRGVAVTVSKELETATGRKVITSVGIIAATVAYETIRSIGDLAWSTRSPGTATFGRYQVTMPFRANITAHAWGGGGGGGGMDAGTIGGIGAPGSYNTTYFQVERGDLLEVFVGSGGTGGGSSAGSAGGGSPGPSRTSINGDDTKSFNGGGGGRAGAGGSSGGGGGGGGASGVLVNNIPVIVAAGGGGGGGAGNDGNSTGNYTRRDAIITNNANGAAGTDFRGEHAQDKSGDGGGGGGGGGGYPGGQGGTTPGGDSSAYSGQGGGNFPALAATTGTTTPYYKSGYADGGNRGGGTGQNGRVFLLIQPLSLMSVKVSNEWKQINEAFVKVGGTWRDIDTVYIKIDDAWREINGTGQADITLTGNTQNYGVSVRSFS